MKKNLSRHYIHRKTKELNEYLLEPSKCVKRYVVTRLLLHYCEGLNKKAKNSLRIIK